MSLYYRRNNFVFRVDLSCDKGASLDEAETARVVEAQLDELAYDDLVSAWYELATAELLDSAAAFNAPQTAGLQALLKAVQRADGQLTRGWRDPDACMVIVSADLDNTTIPDVI